MIFVMVLVAIVLMGVLVASLAMAGRGVGMLWDSTRPKNSYPSPLSQSQVELRADAIDALGNIGHVGLAVESDVDSAMITCPKCDLSGIVNIVVQMRSSVGQ